ncbi:MAG: hypothetical protein P8189_22530, partial [Anaerolineae bacterium]
MDPIVVAVLAFLAVMLIVVGITSPRPADQTEARLIQYGERPLSLEEIELSQPFSDRIVVPMVEASARFVSRFTPQRTLETTRRNLELAGNPNNWSATEFLGIRGLSALLLGALTFFLAMLANVTAGRQLLFT